jgi:hypothetical protein
VLSQNTTQAANNPARANPRRARGRLASDFLTELRVDDNILVKLDANIFIVRTLPYICPARRCNKAAVAAPDLGVLSLHDGSVRPGSRRTYP